MKKMITAITFTLAVLLTQPAHAEHSVGFAAGVTRGLGATYRYLPDAGDESSWGWQVTGLPVITQDSGTISGGGALLYLLHRGDVALAYASLGVGGLAMWNSCDEDSDSWCEEESHWGAGVGPGLGFELRVIENVAFSLEIPLAFMIADREFYGVYPVPNTSLVYYW